LHGRRRDAECERPGAPDQRRVLAAGSAAGPDDPDDLVGTGLARRRGDQLQPTHRRQRRAPYRELLEDADVHAEYDDPVAPAPPLQPHKAPGLVSPGLVFHPSLTRVCGICSPVPGPEGSGCGELNFEGYALFRGAMDGRGFMLHSRASKVVAAVAVLLGAVPIANAHAATNITVATGFMPNVQFAPYYVAQDKGYYKQAGLNVTMNYDRDPNLLQDVASGKFAFASSSGDTATIARAAGAKIHYVAAQYQQYPVGAMWLKSGGPKITKPADLKRLPIATSPPASPTHYPLPPLR